MEEAKDSQAISDEDKLSVLSSEGRSGSEDDSPSGDKLGSGQEGTAEQSVDDVITDENPTSASSSATSLPPPAAAAVETNKKLNHYKKGWKNKRKKKQGCEVGSKNEQVNSNMTKDDIKKQSQESKKIDGGLVPDKGGTYSLWVRKPYLGYTHEEAYKTFVHFGSVAEINFLEQNFFVKYFAKDHAQTAMKRLKGVLNIEPAHVKYPGKNLHGCPQQPLHGTVFRDSTPRPTEVYIGNIALSSSKKELEKLIEDTKFTSLRYHNKNGKGFAFVLYPNLNSAQRAVGTISGKVFQGRALMCRLSEQGSSQTGDAPGISILGKYSPSQHSSQETVAVLVKNLHPDTKDNHLHTLFSRYGGASYVQTKFVSSKNSVEAVVSLHTDWFAQAAIKELQGQIVDGRMITILYHNTGAGHHDSAPHGSHNHHGNAKSNPHSFQGPAAPHSHSHPAVSKLQQATDLAHRVDALIDEVLDDCHFCGRIKLLMSELQYALSEVAEEVRH